MLATRHNRLLTLTFSRSSGFRSMQPQILYLLDAKTGQSHTKCTLSSLSYPHSQHSCHFVCLKFVQVSPQACVTVNSPTAVLRLNLFTARSSLALLGRGYLISTLDCRQSVQAIHLARCFGSNCFLMRFLPTVNGVAVNWLGGISSLPSN